MILGLAQAVLEVGNHSIQSDVIYQRPQSNNISPETEVHFQLSREGEGSSSCFLPRCFARLTVLITQVIESIIIVDLDEDDKIVRVTDQWEGKDLPSWFGSGFLRLLNAKVTPWIVRVPKLAA